MWKYRIEIRLLCVLQKAKTQALAVFIPYVSLNVYSWGWYRLCRK